MLPKKEILCTMERKEDRRAKMTKTFLRHALVELMRTKNINDLSVKEICEKADVNRSTFYKHYETITDLYSDILSDVSRNIEYISTCARNDGTFFTAKYAEAVLNYAEHNRELFLVLLSENGNLGFGEYLVNSIDKIIGDVNIPDVSRYSLYFVVSGMASIIWKWLSEEKRMPSYAMANIVHSLLTHGISRARLISYRNESAEQGIRSNCTDG